MHAQEIKDFSELIYGLAIEQEPFSPRKKHQLKSQSSFEKTIKEEDHLRKRNQSQLAQLPQSTLVHSIKDKYVIRSKHNLIGKLKFLPVNRSEARADVKR